MQEQVGQVEYMSKAREPRPFDMISEGAMQVLGPLAARQLPCQATAQPGPCVRLSPALPRSSQDHWKAVAHGGKLIL